VVAVALPTTFLDGRTSIRRQRLTQAQGLITETFQRGTWSTSSAGTSGQIVGSPVYFFAGELITSIQCSLGSAGTSNTLVKLGICDASGVVQRTTGDASASFTTTGDKDTNLTSTWTVPTDGAYYILFLATGGTIPGLMRTAGSAAGSNGAFGSGTIRAGVVQAGQTDITGTLTLAVNNVVFWIACR
jgi:hypothetical protein